MAIEIQPPVIFKPEPGEAVGVGTVLSKEQIKDIFGGSVSPIGVPLKTELEEILNDREENEMPIDWETKDNDLPLVIRPEKKGGERPAATPGVKIWGEIGGIKKDEERRLVLTTKSAEEFHGQETSGGQGDQGLNYILAWFMTAGGAMIAFLLPKRPRKRLRW